MSGEDLEKLRSLEDPVKRRVFFIGLLSREIVKNDGGMIKTVSCG